MNGKTVTISSTCSSHFTNEKSSHSQTITFETPGGKTASYVESFYHTDVSVSDINKVIG
jgi:hypothetical protein